MSKIDIATATPLVFDTSVEPRPSILSTMLGTLIVIAAAPVMLLWIIGDTLVRDLHRLVRGFRAVGEEVVRAARD